MDPLYSLEARFTDLVLIGPVPDGLRLDAYFEGSVTSGELAGAAVRGVDYLLFRPDGVGVMDARETIAGPGVAIALRIGGYVLPPPGFALPDPDVMASPDFAWPDIALPLHGFATFRTAAPAWRHLNHTIGLAGGAANPGTGTLVVEARAFAPQDVGLPGATA
jgi:hypothetical protein